MKQKILVIFDHSYKSVHDYETFKKCIYDLYGQNYDLVFKLFNPMLAYYEFIPYRIQSAIDMETVETFIGNYACVIIDGNAAYFWLRSFYQGNIIVINPIIDIYNECPYCEDDMKVFDDSRCMLTDRCICILSHEFENMREEYDNVFSDTTVVVTPENLSDIHSFWSRGSSVDLIFNFIIKNAID